MALMFGRVFVKRCSHLLNCRVDVRRRRSQVHRPVCCIDHELCGGRIKILIQTKVRPFHHLQPSMGVWRYGNETQKRSMDVCRYGNETQKSMGVWQHGNEAMKRRRRR